MGFKENLIKYRNDLKISQKNLADKLQVKPATISNYENGVSQPDIDKILVLSEYLGISVNDLIGNSASDDSVSREFTVVGRKEVPTGGIPLVGVEALGGMGNALMVVSERDVLARYNVPDFKDVSFLIPLKGDSMAPSYMAGDLIACRVILERTFIMWGRIYLIATRSHGIIVKRIFPGTTPGTLTCRSDNPDYPPFELSEQDDMDSLALVVGMIRVE